MIVEVDIPPRPFNGGHIIFRVDKPIFDLEFTELAELKKRIDMAIMIEKKKLKPEGFNIHITDTEIHIIPRWCGDINVAFFGGVKVIPLSIDDIRDMIVKELQFS
ncbi:conserved hypothetical protein [Pyrobaculum islandicum DSM 4184]|uniref:HIT domain-containing protein n=1 Tax=Pyrobaculum islandicum (strain DSM 4184 / JCM 9189 / GEO3) TaxID=384616 RepID=A1RV36_PYRIL|nr:hypothetical protein [Pyrobaculum islandicum]ABL88818.1 conserved hypothetical protein [Pyrobaculum islandicum DSM 4184]